MKKLLPMLMLIMLLCGCKTATYIQKDYSDAGSWYVDQQNAPVDVFYIVSTNSAQGLLENGTDSHRALLSQPELQAMEQEAAFISTHFKGMNVYSPYYNQFTLSALDLEHRAFDSLYAEVAQQVCEMFDYYISHLNNGRPFVLCGFSQGGMLVCDLLKHMDRKTFKRFVAGYSLGYRVSKEDLSHPHVKAARGEKDRGVVVSFNSVADTGAVWDFVSSGAATCINPVNWMTDTSAAFLDVNGVRAKVHVDPSKNVLVVEGLNPDAYEIKALSSYCKKGNYHLGDLLFYAPLVGKNALLRSR